MKIKPLNKEQIIISIDRLTRFKNPEEKYLRVFKDIIIHNLIEPKFSKNNLDKMDYAKIRDYAQNILNYSISLLSDQFDKNLEINKKLKEYEQEVFNIDKDTEILLDNEIDYLNFINLINKEEKSFNLQYLSALSKIGTNIQIERYKKGFKFPIETVILAEGATEETLLPEFAKFCNFDFNKNGIHIIPAGGKNQVVKLYYELSETLKIPMFILLDKDGEKNAQEIQSKLRSQDYIYIIKSGEFEDILSKSLVERALNTALENISESCENMEEIAGHRVEYLEEIFKKRGMHEFKKVEFSQLIKSQLKTSKDLTSEIIEIINKIKEIKI